MTVEEIRKYCIGKHKATEEYHFGDIPICYKLNGKIFAQLYPYPEDFKITLKCTADRGLFYLRCILEKLFRAITVRMFKSLIGTQSI